MSSSLQGARSPVLILISNILNFINFFLPTQSVSTPCTRPISAMEVMKNLFMPSWYGPPQEPKKTHTVRVPRNSAKKMQFLEKYIPVPRELRLDASQPVFNVLCEDAVMFYTVSYPSSRISQT
jgi:hypothetical protein